jgi:predicted Holliday junction resolvase-like endonuclease
MVDSLELGLFVGIAIAAIIGILLYLLIHRVFVGRLERWKELELSKEVSRVLTHERPIVKGKISEELYPLIYRQVGNLADLHFIGNPIDYIAFEGLSDARDNKIGTVKVKFIEIKNGASASLSYPEKLVRDAIENRRVEWSEVFINK